MSREVDPASPLMYCVIVVYIHMAYARPIASASYIRCSIYFPWHSTILRFSIINCNLKELTGPGKHYMTRPDHKSMHGQSKIDFFQIKLSMCLSS